MSYDSDSDSDIALSDAPCALPPRRATASEHDILVTLLELAAIELTPTAGATFTLAELYAVARAIGGHGVRAVDLRGVLRGMPGLLAKADGTRWRMV